MRKLVLTLTLTLTFVVVFSGNAFAQEKNGVARVSILGVDNFRVPNDNERIAEGEGDYIVSAELGRGGLFKRVFVIHAGAHDFWGDLFSGGFQIETGPSFLKLGAGAMFSNKQFFTYMATDKDGNPEKTKRDLILAPYYDITLNLGGKDSGFYLKVKQGPVVWSYRKFSDRYFFVSLGIYASY